jgi:hypothetical protein
MQGAILTRTMIGTAVVCMFKYKIQKLKCYWMQVLFNGTHSVCLFNKRWAHFYSLHKEKNWYFKRVKGSVFVRPYSLMYGNTCNLLQA